MGLRHGWKPGCVLQVVVLLGLTLFSTAEWSPAIAAPGETESGAATTDQKAPEGFFDIVFSGGFTGFLIVMLLVALSIGMVALIIEHLLSIRAPVLMPPGLAENVQKQLLAGNATQASAVCTNNPSFLAFILEAGIAEVDGGWGAVEKSMEDAAAEQSARLFRKIEYLSVIANIAPMVGLLGTVFGMIFALQITIVIAFPYLSSNN